jgi:hypothetical protein
MITRVILVTAYKTLHSHKILLAIEVAFEIEACITIL